MLETDAGNWRCHRAGAVTSAGRRRDRGEAGRRPTPMRPCLVAAAAEIAWFGFGPQVHAHGLGQRSLSSRLPSIL